MALPIQLSPEDKAAVAAEQRRKRPAPAPIQPTSIAPPPARFGEDADAVWAVQQHVPPELRVTPSGETTTEWMGRRWSGLLARAGWDPTRLPIPMLHDLATAGVDDRTLISLLDAAHPLQEQLLTRIRERNDRQALAASMQPGQMLRAQAKLAPPGASQPQDHSVVGWDTDRLRREMLGQAVPALASPEAFAGGAAEHAEQFASRAQAYPSAVDNLTEIATDPGRRAKLQAAPWLLQFLSQQPRDQRDLAAAKQSLRGYLQTQRAVPEAQRDAAMALLEDGESPIGAAYMLAAWQSYSPDELRGRGLVGPDQVAERARMNREELPRGLATATGGLVGREKLPLLTFDPRSELEQARLEASGQQAALGANLLHPGRILDGLNWVFDHTVSPALGSVGQLLMPINDALTLRSPDIRRQSPGALTTGAGEPLVELHPEALSHLVTPAEAWRRAMRTGVGGAVAELGGIKPGDKDYRAAAAIFDLAVGFYADPVVAAGRVAGGAKAARVIAHSDELADSSLLRRALRLHPDSAIPEIPSSRLSRLVYQAFGRDVDELAATPRARKTFAAMAAESDPIVVGDRYHLPPAMAEQVAATRDPARVHDLFVAGMRGAIPTFERFEIEARILKNNDEIQRLELLGRPQPRLLPDDTPVNPYQPKIDALRRANAEMTGDLTTNERAALEVRGMPQETLMGSYRQLVKRFVPNPTRRGFSEPGQTSFWDALYRSSRTAEQRAAGKLDDATRTELERQRKVGERWQGELKELYSRRAAGDVSLDADIAEHEKALDKLAATTAHIMEREGLSDQHRLWQAREQLGASHPALRALSWAYNRSAHLRSPFELLPQVGDVISIDDKAQGLRVMERLGQVLDVDRASIDAAMRAYLRATGPEDSRAAVMSMIRRTKALHPEYTNEMLRMWRNNSESLFWVADKDGQDMWSASKRFMGDDMPFAQPHLSSELLSEIPLPDWRAARDLRKLSTRAQLRLKMLPRIGDELADNRLGQVAARFGVNPRHLAAAFRPLDAADQMVSTIVADGWAKLIRAQDILLNRVWTPSVLIRGGWTARVVGEEQLRMAAVGLASGVYHPSTWWQAMRGKGEFARFADRPEELLVSHTRDLWLKTPTGVRIRKGTRGFTTAWRKELKQLAGAQELRVFLNHVANEGEGAGAVDRTMKWLQGNPDGKAVWSQMRPVIVDVLGEGDDSALMRKWVETFRGRVHDKTRGNQALLALARDGEIRMPIDDFAAIKFGGELGERIKRMLGEYQELLGRGDPIPHELRAELEHELGVGLINGAGGTLKVHVPLSDDLTVEKFLDSLPEEAKPNFVKGRGFNWADEAAPASWINAAMEFLGARPTNTFSRLPAYRQTAAAEYRRLKGLGISENRAVERARLHGIEQTRQLLYELGEKSALAAQAQTFSRFFNAWQEVTERWFFHIPLRQGVFGHAALAEKVDMFLDAARGSGLLYQNDRGEWVTKLPGFDRLVSNVMGVPMKTEFNARGFNMLSQLPGLNPWTLEALISLPTIREQWERPGPMKAALDVLAPYGPEVGLGPAWLGRAWWAMSKGGGPNYGAPPWELFSAKYQRTLWDGSVIDAMRVIDAKRKKDTGTSYLEAIAKLPEGPDKDALFAEYLDQAKTMGRHFFTLRAATGALLPAQPGFYWPNTDEAQSFYDQLNKLPEGSPARKAMYDQFIEDHPELTSYLVGKSTAKPGTPRPVEGDDEFSLRAYWRQVETGARTRLAPEDWARWAAGATDYQQVQHDYRTEAAAAGATAAERLRNYGKVLEASNRRAGRLERLRQTNPLWGAQFDIMVDGSRAESGAGRRTYEENVAAQFANDVKVISDLVNDTPLEDQIDMGELRAARRALLDKYGAGYSEVASQQGVEADIARYFSGTLDPYFNQLDDLYAQANAVPRALRGPFYDQVRQLRNSYEVPAGMPGPEEVLYGMADRQQREDLKLKWASQPPGWLSDFQRQTVGLEVGRASQFWTTVNQVDEAVRKLIVDKHWIPQQREARQLIDNFQRWKVRYAQSNGLDEEVVRDELPPFDRAVAAHVIAEPYWQPVAQSLQVVKQYLAANSTSRDGTPSSIDSRIGRPVFDAFSEWLDQARSQSTELDTAFTRWGKILGEQDRPLVGSDLYRVFLFGEFN